AASETAIAAVRRPRVQQLVEDGSSEARALQKLLENSVGFVATTRLIIVGATIAANTLLVALLLEPLSALMNGQGGAYLVIVLLVLFLALVLVGQMGHAYGLRHAEAVALGVAGPARVAVTLLTPVVKVLEWAGGLIYSQPGTSQRESAAGVTEAGIMLQVDVAEEEGVLEEEEGEMIRSIFEFGDTVAREIMVPRIDMKAAEASTTIGELVDMAIEAGHSRIPIYEGSVDRVTGVFYLKDSLRFLRDGRREVKVGEIMRPAYFVPESKKVDELLREMQQRRVHVAIIVDEYGGTAGLATIEDILEEIVGEIQDEFDPEETMVETVNEHETIVDAIMTLDDVNDVLSIQLEDEDVDTLGGYVYAKLGRVPERGAAVEDEGVRLVVEEVEGNRITRVRVVKIEAPETPADGTPKTPAEADSQV
ncbi:MAG TPA: hemolysin family protein, partial [Chloroflexota bacterium]|nr:hemolysin family protein [Chloroflexota bacterium]